MADKLARASVEQIKVTGSNTALSFTAAFLFLIGPDITVIYENNLPEYSAWSPRLMRLKVKEQLQLADLI